jgi:hypothetical protein
MTTQKLRAGEKIWPVFSKRESARLVYLANGQAIVELHRR